MMEMEIQGMDLEPLRVMTELLKALDGKDSRVEEAVAKFLALYVSPQILVRPPR